MTEPQQKAIRALAQGCLVLAECCRDEGIPDNVTAGLVLLEMQKLGIPEFAAERFTLTVMEGLQRKKGVQQ